MKSDHPGEFEIIERIRRLAEKAVPEKPVRLGIGDDCCILENIPGKETVLSIDTVVEDVHFRRSYYSFYEIGGRAMATALSDLAAMAALPLAALSAVSIPKDLGTEQIDELARGMIDTAASYSCPVLGGDMTSSAGGITITVSVVGSCPAGKSITRSGAHPGDEIWISGYPGTAAAVLGYYERKFKSAQGSGYPEPEKELAESAFIPRARIDEAQILADSGCVSAMIDISDGLAADLGHILEQSGCGAEIFADSLPISGYCAAVANYLEKSSVDMVLYGGEDYELCFSVPPGKLTQQLRDRIESAPGANLSMIGRITGDSGSFALIAADGRRSQIETRGFDHFNDTA